jgi:hypothetical protein
LINSEINQTGHHLPELTLMITNLLYRLYLGNLLNPRYKYMEVQVFDSKLYERHDYFKQLVVVKLHYFKYVRNKDAKNIKKITETETLKKCDTCEICKRDMVSCYVIEDYRISCCEICSTSVDNPDNKIVFSDYVIELMNGWGLEL